MIVWNLEHTPSFRLNNALVAWACQHCLPVHAAEQSSSEGWLVQDKFAFPDKGSSIDIVFGCEAYETGEIYRQRADGILGMGNNENSFTRQVGTGKVAVCRAVFLCFRSQSSGVPSRMCCLALGRNFSCCNTTS